MPIALIGPLGSPELLIILVVLILIFGAKRISGRAADLARASEGSRTR